MFFKESLKQCHCAIWDFDIVLTGGRNSLKLLNYILYYDIIYNLYILLDIMSYHAAIRKHLTAQWHNGTIPGSGGLAVCLF